MPVTTAIRALRATGIPFTPRLYAYEEKGGTRHSAEMLQLPEHMIIKTIVMESFDAAGKKKPLIVLMHGDREVSTKQMARLLGVKTVSPAGEADVTKYTGYVPGGVSPFGTRQSLPIYVETSILELDRIVINGGKRGLLVEINPQDLAKALTITEVSVGV